MRLLLDQGLPRTSAALLRERGLDTVHAAECGLSQASDNDIIEVAREHARVVVTLDADFHAALALEGASSPSVVRVRIEGLRAAEMADLLVRVVEACRDDLLAGAVASVRPESIRIRRLPMHPPEAV